jgi:hypothetical protein
MACFRYPPPSEPKLSHGHRRLSTAIWSLKFHNSTQNSRGSGRWLQRGVRQQSPQSFLAFVNVKRAPTATPKAVPKATPIAAPRRQLCFVVVCCGSILVCFRCSLTRSRPLAFSGKGSRIADHVGSVAAAPRPDIPELLDQRLISFAATLIAFVPSRPVAAAVKMTYEVGAPGGRALLQAMQFFFDFKGGRVRPLSPKRNSLSTHRLVMAEAPLPHQVGCAPH